MNCISEPQQKQNSHSDDDTDDDYRDSNCIDNDDIAYNDSTHTGNPEVMGNNMFISVPEVSEYCFLDRIRIIFGIRILTEYEYE